MFLKGKGRYVVEVLGRGERPWLFRARVRGRECVYTLGILQSDNEEYPVGVEVEFGIRLQEDGYAYPFFTRDAKVLRAGLCLELECKQRFTKNGQPFTSFHWGNSVNKSSIQSLHVVGRIVGSTPNVQYMGRPAADGAQCTKCKEHNPYAEPAAAFVCYRCRT